MEKELVFHILKIPATKDEAEITAAYRTLLKAANPEDDPEGFKRLRQAYEEALRLARHKEEEESVPESDVDLWILKVEACYRNLPSRYQTKQWSILLQDPVCQGLDTSLEAREKMLVFLMSHDHLPHSVWKLIDQELQAVADIEALSQQFPRNFLNYMKYYVEHETFMPYELFEYRGTDPIEDKGDAYINAYLNAKSLVDEENMDSGLQALDDLAPYEIYHPYEDVERLRVYTYRGDTDKSLSLADHLAVQYGKYSYVQLYIGDARWSAGDKDEAYKIWNSILEKEPDHYMAKFNTVRYLMETGQYYAARERMMELDSRDERLMNFLKTANETLITQFQDALENGKEHHGLSGDELKIELGWCLLQNERYEEAAKLLENFCPAEEQEYDYCNLYGRLLHQMKRYEDALAYVQRWRQLILSLTDDGTAETQKRISRLGRACYILGGCYFELGRQEEAEQAVEEAIQAVTKSRERLGCMHYLASILLKGKKYEKSIDLCDQIVKEDDQYYPAYLIRQEACYELRKGQEVVDDYHRAVDIYPGFYQPYLYAAEVFFHYGQYEDAKGVIDRAREHEVEFSSRMKLYEAKILRNLARSPEDRKAPQSILEEIQKELGEEGCDIEDKSEIIYEMGLLCWDNDELEPALKLIKQAVSENPDRLQYRMICGDIYLDMKKYKQALKEYAAAESVYGDEAGFYYSKGLCNEGIGYRSVAMEQYQKALEIRDGYRDACEKLADYYAEKYEKEFRQEDFDQAIHYMDRQVAAQENCYYLVSRGLIYMNALELEHAIRDFERALELVPEDWASWNNLGCCYKYLGEFDKAIECLEKAAMHMDDKWDQLPYSNMADCYQAKGEYQKAIDCYKKNLQHFPDNQYTWEEVGDLYYYMGEFEKALDAYDHSKNRMNYYKNIGEVWMKRGDKRKCIRYYKKAVKEAQAHHKAYHLNKLGDLYLDILMDYKKAIACYEKAIACTDDAFDIYEQHRSIAKAYYMMGRYEEAKTYAKKALDSFSKSGRGKVEDWLAYKPYAPARYANMGWICLCLGQKEEAVEYFNKMDQVTRCKQCRHRGCFESSLYMGQYYASQGDLAQAEQQYQIALERNPHCDEARLAMEKIKQER